MHKHFLEQLKQYYSWVYASLTAKMLVPSVLRNYRLRESFKYCTSLFYHKTSCIWLNYTRIIMIRLLLMSNPTYIPNIWVKCNLKLIKRKSTKCNLRWLFIHFFIYLMYFPCRPYSQGHFTKYSKTLLATSYLLTI